MPEFQPWLPALGLGSQTVLFCLVTFHMFIKMSTESTG